jgi:probable HAF family extracellular repeat protein
MKFSRIEGLLISELAAFSLLALAPHVTLAADAPVQQPRYKLIDLGTFGGPASYMPNGFDGILNNRGTAVGWADTATRDPLDPICFALDCFVDHAFQVHNGRVTDLGTLPGGSSSQAVWISGNGLIAGISQNGEFDPLGPQFPEVRAVLWRDGQIIDLGTLPEGGYESLASAVNNRGQVAGLATNTVPDAFSLVGSPTQVRAFLWQDGVMQDLGTLGGPDAIAGLINDRGQVAGVSYTAIDPGTGAPGGLHPFLWANGNMLDLGALPGSTDTEPTALNDRGEVVGWSRLATGVTRPFLFSKGQLVDLGTLGGAGGYTNWINDRGDIAGKTDLAGPAPQNHDAVLWRNGDMIDLGTLPGDSCSNAYYVNSRGQVVGTSENRELCLIPAGHHAFLWENGGPMIDLNTVIPPHPNLELTLAVAINDRGEIAGFGVPPGCASEDTDLCGHAYVLIPCEEEEDCTNTSVGPDTVVSAPTLTRPATPLDKIRTQLQQRIHLPRRSASPSD